MKWVLGLLFAPALTALSVDPALARTVGPEGFGGRDTIEAAGRNQDDGLFRRYSPFDAFWFDETTGAPVVPPVKSSKLRGKPVTSGRGVSAPAPVSAIVGNLLKGGAQHRKAIWPTLDFASKGKPRGGSGGSGGSGSSGDTGSSGSSGSGGGGGWNDGPSGGIPLDGGHDPIDMGGGSAQGPGGQGAGGWDGLGGSGGGSGGGQDCDPISPVPLPAAGWLMMAGLGGLAALGRRRAKG